MIVFKGYSQCTFELDTPIPDEGSTAFNFLISNAAKNNLGVNNKVCGVSIKFQHEGVGDLNVKLISPSGQVLHLIGAGGSLANTTDATLWDISFVPCTGSVLPAPDPGISAYWDNGSLWGIAENYTGSYYPYEGCLEDLNTGTVNGTWSLVFEDAVELDTGVVHAVTIYFCDEELNCTPCDPPVAQPLLKSLSHCQGTDLLQGELAYKFDKADADSINYRITYGIFGKTKFYGYTRDQSINILDTGAYRLCLLAYALTDSLTLPQNINLNTESKYKEELAQQGTCAQLYGCINLQILPVSDTLVKNFEICNGESVVQNGVTFTQEGSFFITSTSGQCDSIINVVIDKIDLNGVIVKSKPLLNCTDNTLMLTAMINENKALSYLWSSPNGNILGPKDMATIEVNAAGKYYVDIAYKNCIRRDSVIVTADVSLPFISLSTEPLTCDRIETFVILATNTTLSNVTWTGPSYTNIGNSIKTNMPGMYVVTVKDNNNCESTASILVTQDTLKPSLVFNHENLTCAFDTISIEVIDSSNIKNIEWLGSAIIDPNNLKNKFYLAGSYQLTLLGYNGCTDTLPLNLIDDKYSIQVSVDSDTITCFQSRALLIPKADKTYNQAIWVFPSGDSLKVEQLQTQYPGMYQLIVIDSNACTGTTQVEVFKDTIQPDLTLSTKLLTCQMDSVQLYADDFDDALNYIWYNATFSSVLDSPFVKSPGVYNVQATDNNGCSVSSTITVLADLSLPNIVFDVDTLKCAVNVANITPRDTAGYDFLWTTNMINAPDDPFGKIGGGGTFKVEVTNRQTLCKRLYEFLVIDQRNYPLFEITADTIGCLKDSTQILFTSNLPYNTIVWSGNGKSYNKANPFVSTPGVYTVSLVDDDGCIFTDSIEVFKNVTLPDIMTQGGTITCDTQGVTIQALITDTLATYEWFYNGNPIGDKAIVNVKKAGLYKVTVMNGRGCSSTEDVLVNADTLAPIVQILPYGRLNCVNKTIDITVNANESINQYLFSGPGNIIQNGNVVTVDSAGVFTVMAIDVSSCVTSMQFVIEDSSRYIKVIEKIKPVTCDSMGHVELTLDAVATGIKWTGPTSIQDNKYAFSTVKNGTYEYAISSIDGCITKGQSVIPLDTISPRIVVISDTLDCSNTSVIIGIATADSLRLTNWNGRSDKSKTISISDPATYSGTAIGMNGCQTNFSIKVIEDVVPPIFTLKGDTIDCSNAKIDLELITNQSLPLTTWTTPDNKILKGQKVKVEKPGKYFVIAKGTNGCVREDSINIINNLAIPVIDLKDTFYLPCNMNPIQLSVQSKDSLIAFRWQGINKAFSSTDKNPMVNQVMKIKLFTAGTNGCNAIDSTNIVLDDDKPLFTNNIDSITCNHRVAQLFVEDVQDDRNFYWYDDKGKIYNTESINVNAAGLYTIVVIGNNFCKDSASVMVTVDTIKPIVLVSTVDSFYCEVKSVTINGSIQSNTDYTYKWTSIDGNFVSPPSLDAEVDRSGLYVLSVTNTKSQCTATDSIDIIYKSKNNLQFLTTAKEPICLSDESGLITISNITGAVGSTQSQINDKPFGDKLIFDKLNEGKYKITIKDSLGCIKDTVITLLPGSSFIVDLPKDTLIDLGQKLELSFTTIPENLNTQNIIWSGENGVDCEDCTVLSFSPTEDRWVKVEIVDNNGCRSADSMWVYINSIPLVDFPNIFKAGSGNPNGLFNVPNLSSFLLINRFEIFDSWGNKVHQRNNFVPGDENAAWDGRFRGKLVNPGVFVVLIEIQLTNGKIKRYFKDVTVVH